jgi:predicted nucleotidyltransferase
LRELFSSKMYIMTTDRYSEILRKVFIKYEQIAFAYLFGSVAIGEQTALSDLDVAVYPRKGARFTFDDTLYFQDVLAHMFLGVIKRFAPNRRKGDSGKKTV